MRTHAANAKELAAIVEVLAQRVDLLAADNRKLHAQIDAINPQHDPPIKWVALKAANRGSLSYETVRAWCELGYVRAKKQGGRWFVDPDSLLAAIASRVPGAA